MGFYQKRFAVILSLLPLCLPQSQSIALEREKSVDQCAGEVVSVHGIVLVRQEDASGNKAQPPISLKPGNNIYAGDVINTASDGTVKILLKDKTIVDIGPSALFKVAQFKPNEGTNREAELDMMFGKMRVAVSKKLSGKGEFKIKTRAATMGVRGTEFVVSSALDAPESKGNATPPKTDVTVLQGKVDVVTAGGQASAAPIHLGAGNQISTHIGAASIPVKLNETQLATVSSSSKLTDNTFMKAVTIEPVVESHSSSASTASNGASSSNRSPAESNGNGGSSSSSTASSTTSAASSAISTAASIAASAPVIPVSFSNIGVPGAPSVVNVVAPVKQTTASNYSVTVVVGR